jgi:chromosome segregation ATPase
MSLTKRQFADDLERMEQEEQKEIQDNEWQSTLEDHDLDDASLNRNNEEPAPKETSLTDEQLYNFRQQNIKALYAKLYSMGLTTEQVRSKLDKMSMFFGHLGSVNNMSDEEICEVSHMIDSLIVKNYKF